MDKSRLRQRARDLRKNSPDAQRHRWYPLRANRLGFKFKRHVPIGTYLVDFVCLEKRLIIELDGSQHNNVFQQTPSVFEIIKAALL
jgi:very-short-patch-repair endonuclease